MRTARIRVNSQFRPRVATSGRDCNVVATAELIRHGTRGKMVLGAAQVRQRMRNPASWTNQAQAQRAVNSIDKEARRRGLRPLRYRRGGVWTSSGLIARGGSRQDLLGRLKRGELVSGVIGYDRVNRRYPHLSGSRSFMGRHQVTMGGYRNAAGDIGLRKRGGHYEVLYADSLWNRPGTPKGPQWVKFSIVWRLLDGAWSSRGGRGWAGGSVVAAKALRPTDPTPPPDPADPVPDACEAQLQELQEDMAERDTQLAEARDTIQALQARRLPRAVVDELLDVAGRIDELVPVVDNAPDAVIEDGVEVDEA
jgi:hypothetical protein